MEQMKLLRCHKTMIHVDEKKKRVIFFLDVTNYKNTLAVFSLRIFMVRTLFHGQHGTC